MSNNISFAAEKQLAKNLEKVLAHDRSIDAFGLKGKRKANLIKRSAALMARYPHLIQLNLPEP